MNYCIVAFGIILVISVVQWVLDGRKNYTGPRIDDRVLEAEPSHEARQETAVPKSSHDKFH